MIAALLVLAYAIVVAVWIPPVLRRLTAAGISARLGLTAWVTAMASVLACAVTVLRFLIDAAIAGWPGLAEAVCRSVTGRACAPAVYRSAVFGLTLGCIAILAAAAAGVTAWRYGRRVQRAQRQTRAHAEAARIAGRRMPAAGQAVVLDEPQPAAYCVPGRPATIVLTSGALAVLDSEQLGAVLAHERAHLAGHHHLLLTLTRALPAIFPAVPLFTAGPAEAARLAEMCADDRAARASGRHILLAALLTMGTGRAVPAPALAATATAITARVQRLLEPPRHARRAGTAAALLAITILLTLATGLGAFFVGPLAAHLAILT
ncbi:MAG TPA: M56 family metallopeptidase [Streptosporangiaceae bacterium]|nr:M56 family metallopeptidase [Streptosporangiaceae bacterium]